MPKYKNDNPSFGDQGPFEATSKEALADTMIDLFEVWAIEERKGLSNSETMTDKEADDFDASCVADYRATFIAGLVEVSQ